MYYSKQYQGYILGDKLGENCVTTIQEQIRLIVARLFEIKGKTYGKQIILSSLWSKQQCIKNKNFENKIPKRITPLSENEY